MSETKTKVSKDGLKEYRKLVLKNFFKKKLVVLGFVITIVMALIAIFAPLIATHDIYAVDVAGKLKAPGNGHLFGTDNLGRDIFSRTIYGVRISMQVGLFTAFLSFVGGMILGLVAGYVHFLDNIIMRICEALNAVPPILIAISLVAALGASTYNIVIALTIVYIPSVARVARASTLSVKEMTYIEAERAQGAGWGRIVLKHIAPNILSPVIVQTTYIFALAIIIEASLSFLGAGVPQPTPSLGNMLYEAKAYIYNSWWMTVYPAIFTVLIVLGLNLFGDGLRDIIDPMSN
ncbi:MAG: ABC transporter permease [Lachnospira sp.]|nr:ABC transporter permease [Lachnospira sp.]MDD5827956.1 ABC transporter permease [Lachnospira sp.]